MESGLQQRANAYSVLSHIHSAAGVGSKVKAFFLKVVMLHIKLKGMEHRASYSVLTHTLNLWVGFKGKQL